MFQSLKRDHSSSDLAAQFRYTGIELVSIAQARPFLFRLGDADTTRFAKLQFQSLKRDHSSSDAGGRTGGGTMVTFQSLKRDHSSSDAGIIAGWIGHDNCFNRSSATIPLPTGDGYRNAESQSQVSIAQARPFLFRQVSGYKEGVRTVLFQSLKRDHSSSDPENERLVGVADQGFNRSSATIPLPTKIWWLP